jgi:DNA-binding HxlR family transcriptional regulator
MTRPYGLPGPVARSLEVVGDRWTLLLVRELLLGPARYADLARALAGIPTNLLAERLRLLEDEEVAHRPDGRAYELTAKGRDLAPVLAGLASWGQRHYGEARSAVAVHAGCGGQLRITASCGRCGAVVAADEVVLRPVGAAVRDLAGGRPSARSHALPASSGADLTAAGEVREGPRTVGPDHSPC